MAQTLEEAVPAAEMPFPITLTERAIAQVRVARAAEGQPTAGLRVGVIGGGCSGLQYLLDFTVVSTGEDFTGGHDDVPIFIDPYSAAHLAGTEIDYVDDLQGTGFKFNNPNIVRACGCGSSFAT